jgi:hypothetical protein
MNNTKDTSAQVFPVIYKWQVSTDRGTTFADLINAPNSPSLSLSNINNDQDDYQYRVVITSGNSVVVSKAASLQVYPKINITQQPINQIAQNGNAVFSFNAVSPTNATTTYQWEYATKNTPTIFYPINNASGTIAQGDPIPMGLSLNNLTRADDDNLYRVKILSGFNSNYKKTYYSNSAKLDILGSPISITKQPTDAFASEDTEVLFSVEANTEDQSLLTYQWQESSDQGATFNNIDLETNNTLVINSLNKNQYQYRVQISSSDASINSSTATLHTGIELASAQSVLNNTHLWGDPHLNLVSEKGSFGRIDDNCCAQPIVFFYAKYPNGDSYKLVYNTKFSTGTTSGPAVISSVQAYKNGQIINSTVSDSKSTITPSSDSELSSCTVAGVTGWNYLLGRVMSLSTVAAVAELNNDNYKQLIINCVKWITKNKTNPNILIFSSDNTEQNNLLKNKLASVTTLDKITITGLCAAFTNSNNILLNKDIVILQMPYYSAAVPDIGQNALIDYVSKGGGLLTTEWTLYCTARGCFNKLNSIFPVYPTPSFTAKSPIRYIKNIVDSTINSGIPDDFIFTGSNNGGSATELSINTAKTNSTIFYHSEQCKAQVNTINVGDLIEVIDQALDGGSSWGTYHTPVFKWKDKISYSGNIIIGGALYWIYKSYIDYKITNNSKFNAWRSNIIGSRIDGYGLVLKPYNITRQMLTDAVTASDNSTQIQKITESIPLSDNFWKNMTKVMKGLVPDNKIYKKNTIYITKQPSNRLGGIAGSISFECVGNSTNKEVITYQWQASSNNGISFSNLGNNSQYSGVKTSILTIKNLTSSMDSYLYRAVISSKEGNKAITQNSHIVKLSIIQSISVSSFPTEQTALDGNASFEVLATSSQNTGIYYQWQKSIRSDRGFTNMTGETNSKLNLKVTSISQNNTYYRVIISDNLSSFTTNPVKLIAVPTLSISTQPNSVTTNQNTASFSVSAHGTSPFSVFDYSVFYAWQYSNNNRTWSNIPITHAKYKNSNSSTLNLIDLNRNQDDKLYFRVIIKNGTIFRVSNSAQLSILPTISSSSIIYTTSYQTTTVDVALRVDASSTTVPLSYQWQQSTNSGVKYTNIAGATTNAIGIRNIPKNSYNNYKYRVLISNSIESIVVY